MYTVYSDIGYPTRKYFCFFSCGDIMYYKHYVAVFGLKSTFEFVVYMKVVRVRRVAAWIGLCSLELVSQYTAGSNIRGEECVHHERG